MLIDPSQNHLIHYEAINLAVHVLAAFVAGDVGSFTKPTPRVVGTDSSPHALHLIQIRHPNQQNEEKSLEDFLLGQV